MKREDKSLVTFADLVMKIDWRKLIIANLIETAPWCVVHVMTFSMEGGAAGHFCSRRRGYSKLLNILGSEKCVRCRGLVSYQYNPMKNAKESRSNVVTPTYFKYTTGSLNDKNHTETVVNSEH